MAVYGYDYYGKSLYGADVAVQYSVEPVTATSIAPGHIQLAWSPATQNAWTTLRILRNPFGVPAHGDDGTVLIEIPQDTPGRTYDDIDLPQGRVYYYGLFLGVAAWASTGTYQSGDVVTYNNINYAALQGSTGIIPGSNTAYWEPAANTEPWTYAGAAAGLSIADHGYAMRLYDAVPRPYKLDTSDVTGWDDGITNPDLYRFLSIFGQQLDTLATQTDILRDLWNVERTPDYAVTNLSEQFGITTEVSDLPMRRRLHTQRAVDIARYRGTNVGIAGLISTLTGWDVEITGSANLMLNQDQSQFANPSFAAWDPNITYLTGDIVDYNGALWIATNSVATVLQGNQMPITADNGQVLQYTPPPPGGIHNMLAYPYPYLSQVNLSGAAPTLAEYVTLSFNVATAATYDISIVAVDGTGFGITTYAIDGNACTIGSVDHYKPPVNGQPVAGTSTRYLGRYTLTAGTHTFTMTVTGRNAAATGQYAGFNTISLTGTANLSLGQVPATGSTWWSQVTAPTGIDTTTDITNPITLGPSTWSLMNLTTAAYPSGLGVASGLPSVTTTATDNSAGKVTNNGGAAATFGVRSVGTPSAPLWASNTTYTLDNLVTDTNGTIWRALVTSIGVQPGTDRNTWEVSQIQGTSPLPMSSMVREWGVPLNKLTVWSPQVSYVTGDQITFNNFAYTALVDSINQQPAGDAMDTTYWQYSGPAQRTWTASAYTRLLAGTAGFGARAFIDWYDNNGALISSVTDGSPYTSGFLQRFDEPMTSLAGQTGYNSSWTWTSGAGTWTTSGTWVVSDGRLSPVDPTTTPYVVWALNTIASSIPTSGTNFYLTFMSRPRLGTAAAEHGLVFRAATNAASFWMASRTRLTTTVSGVITTLATWPEVPDGGRIYVNYTSTTTSVYQYTGPGLAPTLLASVPTTTSPEGPYFGVLERSL